MKTRILTFIKYRYLLKQLVIRDIKVKYKRSILGVLWSILNPLLTMAVLNIVFSEFFRFEIDNFIVYYLSGSILFSFMSEATGMALPSIFANGPLLTKVYIPKFIFPLSRAISSFVNLGYATIALLIMVIITGVKITWAYLFFPIVFLLLLVFVIGLCFIFSTYAVFFRDLQHLHGIFILIWTYITPLFYPPSILPEKYQWLLDVNPIYPFIVAFREIILNGSLPSLYLFVSCTGIATITFVLGVILFYKNQNKFIMYL